MGYHVRLDAAVTRATRLMFCTTGILLRRLAGDAQLQSVSHVIVDEVGVLLPFKFQRCQEQSWQTSVGAPGRSSQAMQACA